MMKRVHALVVLAALFSLVMVGGCTAEESSDSNGANGDSAANGATAPLDLTTVDLKAAVAEQIAASDEYGCCLKMPCSQCMVNMGMCPCAGNIADDKPVCHECKGGWTGGGGGLDGVEADDVKVMDRGGM